MENHEDWAKAIQGLHNLTRRYPKLDPCEEPAMLVQKVTGNLFVAGGPVESYSKRVPVWIPTTPEEENLLPIDFLYGAYFPESRSMEIYFERIRIDSGKYGAEPGELELIVRLHEYAHALVHTGIRDRQIRAELMGFANEKTDWDTFATKRNVFWNSASSDVHELLAQAITYSCLRRLPQKGDKLCDIFNRLEEKQPPKYKISAHLKEGIANIDWQIVLDAARGDLHVCTLPDFSLYAGVAALMGRYC